MPTRRPRRRSRRILKAIDVTAQQVASALVDVYAQAARGVAELLTSAGYVVADIARALTDVFNRTAAEVASVLRTVGYAIADITRVLDDVFAQTVARVASILKSISYTVTGSAPRCRNVPRCHRRRHRRGAAAGRDTIDLIGGVLESVYNQVADQAAATLRATGYAIAEIPGPSCRASSSAGRGQVATIPSRRSVRRRRNQHRPCRTPS